MSSSKLGTGPLSPVPDMVPTVGTITDGTGLAQWLGCGPAGGRQEGPAWGGAAGGEGGRPGREPLQRMANSRPQRDFPGSDLSAVSLPAFLDSPRLSLSVYSSGMRLSHCLAAGSHDCIWLCLQGLVHLSCSPTPGAWILGLEGG